MATPAGRVCEAHAARVWLPLGHGSWASCCGAEFGICCALACRLADVACALAVIHDAVTARTGLSRTPGTGPAAAVALGFGLSQRALMAVCARRGDFARLITRRLAMLTRNGLQHLDEPAVRAVVGQASARCSPGGSRRRHRPGAGLRGCAGTRGAPGRSLLVSVQEQRPCRRAGPRPGAATAFAELLKDGT
ncbi:hypothetical protein ACFCWG_11190 [Streptomyces sp. NPDC056390]|uniref:hypothetical protein n=1 Tax=Streptomyces sp. NPDC056390 TaxID=3345806 RepID=UPI0035D72FF1